MDENTEETYVDNSDEYIDELDFVPVTEEVKSDRHAGPGQKNAYIAIVTPGGIEAETVMSLCQTLTRETSIHWNYGYGSESLVERARNLQAEFFYNYDPRDMMGDVILFVDSDITFTPEEATHVVEKCYETRGIVGGLYTSRWDFDVFLTTRFLSKGVNIVFGEDNLVEVEAVSGGFMAIHRDVLDGLEDKVGYFMNRRTHPKGSFHRWFACDILKATDGNDLFASEDWYLCMKAREHGFKVYADTLPILGHIGRKKFTVQDMSGVEKL